MPRPHLASPSPVSTGSLGFERQPLEIAHPALVYEAKPRSVLAVLLCFVNLGPDDEGRNHHMIIKC